MKERDVPLVVDGFKEGKCYQKQSKYLHSWLCIVEARLTYREAQRIETVKVVRSTHVR